MVEKLISFSLKNRVVVLFVSACLFGWGVYSIQQNPIDAIPDLSKNQVIVFSEWLEISPQVMENQVTYPLVSNLQGIPKIKNLRAVSMFGMSFVYIIFDDDVNIYWPRTRVMEKLNCAQRLLQKNIVPTLGPDGTGTGHVFWCHLEANGMDLGEQRALQDWYVKFALQTVTGVAEVASFGGFEKQYQLVLDSLKMQYYNVSMMEVMNAVKTNNNDVGGRKFEMSDMSYIVRGLCYIENIKDVEDIAIAKQDYPIAYKQLSMPGDYGENAKNMFDASKQKLLFYGLSNAQIESIKTTHKVSPYIIFYSASSGYVSDVTAAEGSYLMEGSAIIKLADLNTLWLEVQVNVNYLKNINLDQNATVSFVDYPNATINAKVTFINLEINQDSRLFLIRMEVPNPKLLLKPGMQAIAIISQPNLKELFLPVDAVIREENASCIWVEKSHDIFENIMVETGVENNGMIEIKSELDTSKKEVITGAYAINSEYKFRKGRDPMEGMKM